MNIVFTRRISQVFFFIIFLWFCIVTTSGQQWWQLRGWPVNWILQLDPLVGLTTLLSTRTIYKGLIWGLATIVLTIILGRFFCGWICPFGAIHQFISFLAHRKSSTPEKIKLNKYHTGQLIKYLILIFLLTISVSSTSLQIGLLDPIPLIYRSVNLLVLPLLSNTAAFISIIPRAYDETWLIAAIFLTAILLNIVKPRFYCRFICPTGALFGILSSLSLFRMGKIRNGCNNCGLCEKNCEGACSPISHIKIHECVLCMNCLNGCHSQLMTYQIAPSASGEILLPDLSRRQFITAAVSGSAIIPMIRINGYLDRNWNPALVRPPGSLPEKMFLSRCIKCGQCMRICPTNVIHPAGLQYGIEELWTPVLNFRIGTSGCQINCIACGNICPTAAIKPINIDERLGRKSYAKQGHIKIGTAFIDRGRCLPWAMEKPCIVCQENCPVSPKAILIREIFSIIDIGLKLLIAKSDALYIEFQDAALKMNQFATGDYYAVISPSTDQKPRRIVSNWERGLRIANELPFESPQILGSRVEIQIRLQQPYINPSNCIGCGVCEHECPIHGKRAIRVTADNESRASDHVLMLK